MNRHKRESRRWKRKTYTGFIKPRRISLRARGRMLAKALEAAAREALKGTLGLSAD